MTAVMPPAALPGVSIGPTWMRGVDGKFVLPELTLGWQILGWTSEYLLQPDGPNAGEPWQFTNEQARFVLWWYAVDEHGRFLYRSGMLRRMKGWGKDPLGAALCCVELVGPCRFGGFNRRGEPVAVPHPAPWVLTAAVSREQTRNTMTLFPGMFSPAAVNEFRIDVGIEVIHAQPNGRKARLDAITSSPRAAEGMRPSFTLKNETHHWIKTNEGTEMSKVIARNAAKSRDGSSRALAISNAHEPGEESDAEHDYDAYMKIETGKSKATGFLYDSLEAPPETEMADRASLESGLLAARGDSYWLDPERIIEEIYDPRTHPSTSRRFYLNQVIAAEDAWVSPQEWDACADIYRPMGAREQIALGFDGSKSDDHSVLVAETIEDAHQFPLGVWDPSEYAEGEIPMRDVDERVRWVFEHFDVVAFESDYHPFESYVDRWEQDFGESLCAKASAAHPIRFDMRANQRETTAAVEAYHDAICERALTHSNDVRMNQYVYNARRNPNTYGVTFRKETAFSSRKIDGAAAGMLAHKARQAYMALPESKKRKRGGKAEFFWVNE